MGAPLVGTGRVVGHFRLEVTAAGTPQPLSDATIVRIAAGDPEAVVIQAASDNTDDIVLGATTAVVNTEATRDGLTLAARDMIILGVASLGTVFVDADVSGEAVTGLLLA